MEAYFIHLACLALIYMLMTMSFNLVVGYTGLMNFGHVGLMGVGAYTSTVLMKTYEVSFWVALLSAAVLTTIVAVLLTLPAKKIKGDYYALVTLGFSFVALAIFINWKSVTNGTLGLAGIPRPEVMLTNGQFLSVALLITAGTYIFLQRLVDSPFGRALEAVRDDEEVAAALGKPIFKLKTISMGVAGFIVGIAGALMASFVRFIDPATFHLDLLVWALAGMMIGGIASMRGSILGVLILFAVEDVLRRMLELPSDLIGPARLMIFMGVLILVLLYKPKGILGRAQLEG